MQRGASSGPAPPSPLHLLWPSHLKGGTLAKHPNTMTANSGATPTRKKRQLVENSLGTIKSSTSELPRVRAIQLAQTRRLVDPGLSCGIDVPLRVLGLDGFVNSYVELRRTRRQFGHDLWLLDTKCIVGRLG